jgi:hypothetical protein
MEISTVVGSALGAMRLPQSLVGQNLVDGIGPLCRVSAPQLLFLWTTSPGARALGTSSNSTTRVPTCLKSSCLQRGLLWGGTCGWRSALFGRELHEIVVGMGLVRLHGSTQLYCCWCDGCKCVTNTNVPRIGARLPLPGSLALGAQHCKLDADLCTSALLGTPSVQSVHVSYPFALEDGGRLAPIAAELVDRMDILVAALRFLGMGAADSRSLRPDT